MTDKFPAITRFLERHGLSTAGLHGYVSAFTHSSYNENKKNAEDYQRLEFLGDAIIGFIVTDHIYQLYPKYGEGQLSLLRSLLVSRKHMAEVALRTGFSELLLLGKIQELNGERKNSSILSDSFEAFVGAMFRIDGLEKARKFVLDSICFDLESIVSEGKFKNPKNRIQEYTQKRFGKLPSYELVREEIEDGARHFIMRLSIDDLDFGPVKKNSKQEAEEELARLALDFFNGID